MRNLTCRIGTRKYRAVLLVSALLLLTMFAYALPQCTATEEQYPNGIYHSGAQLKTIRVTPPSGVYYHAQPFNITYGMSIEYLVSQFATSNQQYQNIVCGLICDAGVGEVTRLCIDAYVVDPKSNQVPGNWLSLYADSVKTSPPASSDAAPLLTYIFNALAKFLLAHVGTGLSALLPNVQLDGTFCTTGHGTGNDVYGDYDRNRAILGADSTQRSLMFKFQFGCTGGDGSYLVYVHYAIRVSYVVDTQPITDPRTGKQVGTAPVYADVTIDANDVIRYNYNKITDLPQIQLKYPTSGLTFYTSGSTAAVGVYVYAYQGNYPFISGVQVSCDGGTWLDLEAGDNHLWYKEVSLSTSPVAHTIQARVYDELGDCVYTSAVTVYVQWSKSGGGGCPYLYVYSGSQYVNEGLLDIHSGYNGTDLVRSHILTDTPAVVDHTYVFRLTEHWETISHINQVKLYATLSNGKTIQLPLVSAVETQVGNVLPQLLLDDNLRATEFGAKWNNGASQSIDLRFLALPPWIHPVSFTFVIIGYNVISKF
ncbi:MAG: hypothetical protein WED04_03180 [Promethearchaeati archaeon SRVP18_Atabeyarchaeia-1]